MIAGKASTSKVGRMPMSLMTSLAALLMLPSSQRRHASDLAPSRRSPQAVLAHPKRRERSVLEAPPRWSPQALAQWEARGWSIRARIRRCMTIGTSLGSAQAPL